MQAILLTLVASLLFCACECKDRVYYIQAEEVVWNYAPFLNLEESVKDPDVPDPHTWLGKTDISIGREYIKCIYFQYEDSDFEKKVKKPIENGFLGPTIRANVGDTIKIFYRNDCSIVTSMHPHGVSYKKKSEGATYPVVPDIEWGGKFAFGTDPSFISPREKTLYTWEVPKSAGPGPADGSSIVWLYHSHIHETPETNSGLVGTIVICGGEHCSGGHPTDVDREHVLFFSVINENVSPLLSKNIAQYLPADFNPETVDHDAFEESNLHHVINGYMFNSLPNIVAVEGELVRWYLVALGTEVDLHSAHWHGNTVTTSGRRTDVVELLPASMKVADGVVENTGDWMLHCHVNDHFDAGMTAIYSVRPKHVKSGYKDFNTEMLKKFKDQKPNPR